MPSPSKSVALITYAAKSSFATINIGGMMALMGYDGDELITNNMINIHAMNVIVTST